MAGKRFVGDGEPPQLYSRYGKKPPKAPETRNVFTGKEIHFDHFHSVLLVLSSPGDKEGSLHGRHVR